MNKIFCDICDVQITNENRKPQTKVLNLGGIAIKIGIIITPTTISKELDICKSCADKVLVDYLNK